MFRVMFLDFRFCERKGVRLMEFMRSRVWTEAHDWEVIRDGTLRRLVRCDAVQIA